MSSERLKRIVVGAGVAGLSALEKLRRIGYAGALSFVGTEPHVPYDRPPLSKQLLSGAWESAQVSLRSKTALQALDAQWLLGDSGQWLDLDNRQLFTSGGSTLEWDGLVLAPGARPRRLPAGHQFANVHVLRTVDDALALRSAFHTARRVVVIGGGFLGSEVAATARTVGLEVTLVDSLSGPMVRHLGRWVGGLLAKVHESHGVELAMEVCVQAIRGRRQAESVLLTDGRVLPTDLVVVAIGCEPDVAWLQGSGIAIDDGIVCDSRLRAAMDVVAAGDAASWFNPAFARTMRVEHRLNAAEQGAAAAANLLGGTTPYSALPYFWSDQFEVRLQAYGDFSRATHVEVIAGDVSEQRFAAIYHAAADGPVAGITWNLPKQGANVRRYVLDGCAARLGVTI
jgi:3-phenylpropionate/trans-cinnamate dioxygenase ferredoxin reductase subunit